MSGEHSQVKIRMNFIPMGNKLNSMKKLSILLSLFILAGGVASAQDSMEDFTTPEPNIPYQVSNLSQSDLDLSNEPGTDSTWATVHGFGTGTDEELLRGTLELEVSDAEQDLDVYYTYFESDSYENVESREKLETINNGEHEIFWDESDWSEDFIYSSEYPGIQIETSDGSEYNAFLDYYKLQDTTTTYQETFHNGTLSSEWTQPGPSEVSIDGSGSVVSVGEEEYAMEIETEDEYVLEYDLDEPISAYEFQYWMSNIAVEDNTVATYGLGSEDIKDSDVYGVDQGGQIRSNTEGDTYGSLVINGQESRQDSHDLSGDNGEVAIQTGGGIGTSSIQLSDDSVSYVHDDLNGWSWNLFSTWNAEIPTGDGTETMPTYISDVEYDQVTIHVEKNGDEGESAVARFDNITYDQVASDTDPDEVIDIGEGEPIDDIEDRNEIIDGGVIDDSIRLISDSLGVGLTTTRIILSLILSLGVGLAIGWSEEYGSTELGVSAFGLTFVTTILIGLMPILYGIMLLLVIGPAGWKIYKNKQTKVVT